ncbi:unnamed protein product [Sphagnum jensenii]|uniref:Uncharacterized protein n=1 Tax=Sphagnum jensenii TaxID=128206 RepID=A0ABP0VB25_9BRYO
MQVFIKADFKEEVVFGIRHEPQSLSENFQSSYALVLTIAGEIGPISMQEIVFFGADQFGDQKQPPLRKLARSDSVRVGNTPPVRPQVMRATSLVSEGDSHATEGSRKKFGNVVKHQITDTTAIFVFNIENSFGFKPTLLTFKIVSNTDYISVQTRLSTNHVMVGALFDRLNSKKLSTIEFYEHLFFSLNTMITKTNPLNFDMETLLWIHGAILSYAHDLSYEIGIKAIDQSSILVALGSIAGTNKCQSWLILVAVGHAIGTLQASESSTSMRPKIISLWRMARDVLYYDRDKDFGQLVYKLLDRLEVRMALNFLLKDDSSKINPPPTYLPYTGVIPLMVRLKFLEAHEVKTIHYKKLENKVVVAQKNRIKELTQGIEKILTDPHTNKRIDAFMKVARDLKFALDDISNRLFDYLAGQTEEAVKSSQIWSAANDIVYKKLNYNDVFNRLVDELLPRDADARGRVIDPFTEEFEEAIAIWKLLYLDTVAQNNTSGNTTSASVQASINKQKQLELMKQYKELIDQSRACFSIMTEKQQKLKKTLEQFESISSDIYTARNAAMKKSFFNTLNEIENMFTVQRDMKAGFIGIFPDNVFSDRAALDSAELLCITPPQAHESKDGFSIVVIDSHSVRQIHKSQSLSKSLIAGNVEAGYATGLKNASRLCEPRGICIYAHPMVDNKIRHTTIISDTGNNCLRSVVFNHKYLFEDELHAFAGSAEAGFADGEANMARFNSPAGLVVVQDFFILCDTNNHVLRRLRLKGTSDSWVVDTVAGQPEVPGVTDGLARHNAHLSSPYQGVYEGSSNMFYFTEQSMNPAVRALHFAYTDKDGQLVMDINQNTITTVHRGSPFIHLNGLCVGENNVLLVCDSGSGCIWSVDLANNTVSAKITAEQIFVLTTHVVEDVHYKQQQTKKSELKSSYCDDSHVVPTDYFSPLAIIHMSHIAPGYYIFSDKNSKHMLFKYFDQNIVVAETQQMDTIYNDICEAKKLVIESSRDYNKATVDTLKCISDSSSIPFNLKNHAFEISFIQQIKDLEYMDKQFENSPSQELPFQLHLSMLSNAPTLQALSALVQSLFVRFERQKKQRMDQHGILGNILSTGYGGAGSMGLGGMGGMGLGGMMGMGRRKGRGDRDREVRIDDEFGEMSHDEREQMELIDCLVTYLNNAQFTTSQFEKEQEIVSLYNIVKALPSGYPRQATVVAALRNDGHASVSRNKEKDGTRMLREPVLQWIQRLLPMPEDFIDSTFEGFLELALNFWTNILNKFSKGTALSEYWDDVNDDDDDDGEQAANQMLLSSVRRNRNEISKEENLRRTWKYLVCVYFESLCAGSARTGRSISRNKHNKLFFQDNMIDKSEKFLEYLPVLFSSSSPIVHDVVGKVSSTLAVRNVGPTKSVHSLLKAINNAESLKLKDVAALYANFQYIMSDIAATAYSELIDSKRHNFKTDLAPYQYQYRLLDVHPAGKWSGLLKSLQAGTLQMNVLDRYGEFLLNPIEIKIFVRTACSIRRAIQQLDQDTGAPSEKFEINPEGHPEESNIVSEITQLISRWNHVQLFYVNRDYVNSVLMSSRIHLADTQHIQLSVLKSAMDSVFKLVTANGPWMSQKISMIQNYWVEAAQLEKRLLKIPFELLIVIQNKFELLSWLSTIRDDEVFASSIEMARSLQEMNAPIELWDSLSGRVNERFLSMISNIRGYLHSYLYDVEHPIPSFDVFLKIMSELNTKTDPVQIVNNIISCYDVRAALSRIIGIKTDISGSSRLVRLYSAECDSYWRCARFTSIKTPGADGSVALKYKMEDDSEEGFVWRQHLSGDLLDFQSNIVLERSLIIGKKSDDNETESLAVDNFLSQFSWMRRLSDVLLKLYDSGHFEFNPEYCVDIPVKLDDDYFRQKVLDLEKEKVDWQKHVKEVRKSYYYVNFFDLKRCFKLLNHLKLVIDTSSEFDRNNQFIQFCGIVKNFVCFLNPEYTVDLDAVLSVSTTLIDSWIAYPNTITTKSNPDLEAITIIIEDDAATSTLNNSHQLLSRIAYSIEKAFAKIPPRNRPLNIADIDRYVVNERIRRGIFVAFGQSLKMQYDQLMTISAIQNRVFEWENCLICTKTTNFEQVALLLHRWHRSFENNRNETTYALIEVDKLSYEVQFEAVQMLRELGSNFSSLIGPLILIAESGDNCYLAAQFIQNRINAGILPAEKLSQISTKLSSYGEGCYNHVSKVPGAGKSFVIRSRAVTEHLDYVHVPINSSFTPTEALIKRIHENSESAEEMRLIHFDIASSGGSTLIGSIFSICVMGILADIETEVVFSYHPKQTAICIELAPGLQFGVFNQFLFYPTIENTASAASFCFDPIALENGMGHEFSAMLYGNLTADLATTIPPSNAYDRLYYVVVVLEQFNICGGAFPHTFAVDKIRKHSKAAKPIPVEPDVAFNALMKACGLGHNPSLWCVWSFINVMYWQLQEIENKSSPVYLACLPDDGIKLMTLEFDSAMKARVKGEMINFIITTAREFATRQTSQKFDNDPTRIVGVIVKNLWIPESKTKNLDLLFWKRERFDNDGHPVYRSPVFYHNYTLTGAKLPDKRYTLYLHFRESEGRWVIDDTVNYTGFEKCMQGSGSVAGPDDNGTYALSPHGVPNAKSRWVIAKTCNAEVMGACAYTRTDLIDSKTYVYYPPNKVHTDCIFREVMAGEVVDVLTAEAFALAESEIAVNISDLVGPDIVESGTASDLIAICHRSIYGKRLHDGIQVLAALNPYRLRKKKEEMGLTFNLGHNPVDDPMSRLVYRVHPIPPTLKDFIFDFGSLEPETELLYIQSMVTNDKELLLTLQSSADEQLVLEDQKLMSILIHKSQEYVRSIEGDPSVVSLRDVKRTVVLMKWFYTEWPDELLTGSQVTPVARALVLSLAHAYCYRLSSSGDRSAFWSLISAEVRKTSQITQNKSARFTALGVEDTPHTVVTRAQTLFVENLLVEDGISMNLALSENLFVSIVCILNKIPIFIVGKPGTSKTLAMQVIQNNLQGRQSPKEYWRSKPSVHIFQYQCSPMSTSHAIKVIFEAAKSFQEHSSDVLTLLLLDEVGLAENSPDMPLKVLHYMLVDPPIAIVGLSNWALDSSKMNRAVCLQRPEPSEKDIMQTGRSIVTVTDYTSVHSLVPVKPAKPMKLTRQLSRTSSMHSWLGPLGKTYLQIYTNQKDLLKSTRDFIGMRDYYSMLKFLRFEIKDEMSPDILAKAVARNFGGHPNSIPVLLPIFFEACFPTIANPSDEDLMVLDNDEIVITGSAKCHDAIFHNVPATVDLIKANLTSSISRHIMILSKNETVLNLLFGCGIVDESSVSVLVGSRFKDDLDEFHLIQQINKVKKAMAEGKVAVLLNNDNIYESLYDVLNQRYVMSQDKRLLRLAMGSRSQLCPVENGFKLIVIVQQNHAYENLDLPLSQSI